jgi:hypothetical protein
MLSQSASRPINSPISLRARVPWVQEVNRDPDPVVLAILGLLRRAAKRPSKSTGTSKVEEISMHWIDHDFLPDIGGTVERFIINHHGEIDGLVLEYELDRFVLVHLPPHLGPEITSAIKPGDALRVRGVRPRGADMISAVAIFASDGRLILDNGPDGETAPRPKRHHEKTKRSEIAGVVRMSLFGPKGELRGALLESGDVIRVGPKEAARIAALLRPGSPLAARGEGLESAYGRVVSAAEIGLDPTQLRPVGKSPAEPKPKKPHRVSERTMTIE